MNISRQHYEEYFLLYVDNELNDTERKAVEAFVQQNPDLEQELIALQQSVVRPDQHLTFTGKIALLKQIPQAGTVNEANYEEYFVLYGDDELSHEQKEQVEQFVYKHPQYEAEFELVLQARLEPDTLIGFPDKKLLYRSEKERRLPAIRWWYAAAAVVTGLFLIGLAWVFFVSEGDKHVDLPVVTANEEQRKTNKGAKDDSVIGHRYADKDSFAAQRPSVADENYGTTDPAIPENNKSADRKATPSIARTLPAEKATSTDLQDVQSRNAMVRSNQAADPKPANNDPEKLMVENSNTLTASSVTLQEATVKQAVKAGTSQIDVKGAGSLAAANSPKTTDDLAMAIDDETENDPFTTTTNKKNRMRGLFRKVSRVFERTTNLEPADHKGAIRIANFEIALK